MANSIYPIYEKIKGNIQKVIVGKSNVIDLLLISLFCQGHMLVEDVPGTGKTLLVKSLAASIDCTGKRVQFTPDLLPSDITGINFFNMKTSEFEFVPGPIFSNLVIADEINRATPKTQSGLLECMEEMQTTIDGKNAWWNIEDGKIYTTEYEYAYQNHKLVYYNGDWWAVSNSQVDFGYTGFVYYDDVCWYVENGRVNFTKTGFVDFDGYGAYEYIQNGQHDSDFNGLVYAELGGKTSWWQVQHGRCYHYDGTWYYEPGNYAANASGLWAIINGEAAFNVNGVYTVSRGYDMDMGVPSTTINYTYEVVNGLVTDMQVVVQQ